MLNETFATVRWPADGKATFNWGKPEDLPLNKTILKAFGTKSLRCTALYFPNGFGIVK
jgi:hypothetical protein